MLGNDSCQYDYYRDGSGQHGYLRGGKLHYSYGVYHGDYWDEKAYDYSLHVRGARVESLDLGTNLYPCPKTKSTC